MSVAALHRRCFHEALTFIARGMAEAPEYNVSPDYRTPLVTENSIGDGKPRPHGSAARPDEALRRPGIRSFSSISKLINCRSLIRLDRNSLRFFNNLLVLNNFPDLIVPMLPGQESAGID